MAKCDLSSELDEPDRIYFAADTISGTVHVSVDADVKCKGLEVSSLWRTHGRGNIASETAQTITVFSGEWIAGERHSYRFELSVADWPPSYRSVLRTRYGCPAECGEVVRNGNGAAN